MYETITAKLYSKAHVNIRELELFAFILVLWSFSEKFLKGKRLFETVAREEFPSRSAEYNI